ncbi:predicted protein [Phaeodactylum tricornutum CCAP 1055/1]|jgi:CBS domain-containing protein|uniref:CBS domain-containing protein n=2 Tax=Phaeodactylum tricornutum TaxID=2850 RepID=B7G2R8_PHATC|nr:predicted protein [Phaeodactylum tricornutum CCAP 1055/1]EEC47177.1 predicted protein [Phaeodactylum tricornutum CCAP 1055/1]|eukprot:XP_002181254.1 predicted protein [Phaeodactylum tricornutum CCAP 1055/1]
MLRCAATVWSRQARPVSFASAVRSIATVTADDALKYSGYMQIDFTIPEDTPVYDAVQKFAAFNIGCLVTTDKAGNMTGVVSERDYICKIALLGRTSKETPVKEIATRGANIITAKAGESVESCMEKMMSKGIRHLPIVDDAEKVIGMVSIKDLVKTVITEKEQTIKVLSDFALGKGGHFGSE